MLVDNYNCGIDFVVKHINPKSAYGTKEFAALTQYKKSQRNLLEQEFNNIEFMINLIKCNDKQFIEINKLLSTLADISKFINNSKDMILTEIDLFHIKCFLLDYHQIRLIVSNIDNFDINGLEFTDLTKVLDIIDPDNKRIRTFTYLDVATDNYKSIIKSKKEAEQKINNKNDKELMDLRNELIKQELVEEELINITLTKKLSDYINDISIVINSIGKLDLLIQKSELAIRFKCVKPVITESDIKFTNISNPMVEAALKKNNLSYQPVSFELNKGTTILTGVNMGGKSVVLKTLILNIQLFLYGFYCFAETASIPIFDSFTLICEDNQSIKDGLSTFAAQMIQLQSAINTCKTDFLLIAFDEPARGTNPSEGAAIAFAAAKYFSDKNCIYMMTTHYDLPYNEKFKFYEVIGLTYPKEKFKVNDLHKHMNYNLRERTGSLSVPKDAVKICHLLNLDKDFLDLI